MPNSRFSQLGNVTNIEPYVLGIILLLGILTILLPRKYALFPIILASCFITLGQRMVIFTLDFTMIRILILFGFIRIILKQEHGDFKPNIIDKILVLFCLAQIITYTLLWSTSGAFINRLGRSLDALGIYFLCRFMIQDIDDIKRLIRIVAILSIPMGMMFIIEKYTGRNFFSIFGGVPEITNIRDGKLRCQGPFRHPILAGTFGATIMPLFFSLWWQGGKSRLLAIISVLMVTFIAFSAASSGAAIAYLSALIGLSVFFLRKYLRFIRWGILFSIIFLHLIMKAPVWFIFAKIGYLVGGEGRHRSRLIDGAISHFSDWWLVGTKSTAYWGWIMYDVTNQYIRIGVDGGIISLGLFIALIVFCFKAVGKMNALLEYRSRANQMLIWTMGVSLFAHTTSFLSISYFDQITVFWYALLAMIANLNSLLDKLDEIVRSVMQQFVIKTNKYQHAI